jgi:phosphoglycolate phosphatase-like HAD superfamily hydrolase
MALELIVFDCDGVILESLDIKTRAFYRVGLEYGQEAADRLVMHHRMHGGVSRYEKFAWLYDNFVGRAITEAEKKALNEKFVAIALEEITRCDLVPGMRESLDAWQGRVPMYVASGAPREELVFILERRGLAPYFKGIFGHPPHKGALLRSIVETEGADPRKTVMVGDSFTDLRAAENAGTLFYGRGEAFRETGHAWHEDLTRLNDYLETLAASA